MKVVFWVIGLLVLGGSLLLCRNVYVSVSPKISALKAQFTEFNPGDIQMASQILDDSQNLIATTGPVMRLPVRSESLPPHVVHAFLAAEDAGFFSHFGISPLGIIRAAFVNLKAGRIVQGASTITQQLAKLLFLSSEKSLNRKFNELIIALTMEREFSKREILDLYLTTIYFGRGAYGLEAASRAYFAKPSKALSVSEAALLAGIPKAPARYAPTLSNKKRSEWRRRQVLTLMKNASFIDDQAWKTALSLSPKIQTSWTRIRMPISLLREIPKEATQFLPVNALGKGVKIHSTFSKVAQERLNSLANSLTALIPKSNLGSYEVAGLTLAHTGEISALRSSKSEDDVFYNYALQMKRPLGAIGIPVIAELAFRDGASWNSSVRYWENGVYAGKWSMFEAMKAKDYYSMSGVVDQVGVAGAIQTLKRAGISSKFNDIRTAAGFDQVTLLQMARLGSLWARLGTDSAPVTMISRMDGFSGKNYFLRKPFKGKQVLPLSSSKLLLAGLVEASPCGTVTCYLSLDPLAGNLHLMVIGKKSVSVVWLGGKTGETLSLSPAQLLSIYKTTEKIYKPERESHFQFGSEISYIKKSGKRIPVML